MKQLLKAVTTAFSIFATTALFAAGAATPVKAASIVFDATNASGSVGTAANLTWGMRFTVDSGTLSVTGLAGIDLTGGDQEVGLWTDSGALLASTKVSSTSATIASQRTGSTWYYESIAEQILNPGTYRVGIVSFAGSQLANGRVSNESNVSLLSGYVRNNIGGGFGFPDLGFGSQIIAASLVTGGTSVAPIPLPGAGLLLFGSLAGAGLVLNRRKRPVAA